MHMQSHASHITHLVANARRKKNILCHSQSDTPVILVTRRGPSLRIVLENSIALVAVLALILDVKQAQRNKDCELINIVNLSLLINI